MDAYFYSDSLIESFKAAERHLADGHVRYDTGQCEVCRMSRSMLAVRQLMADAADWRDILVKRTAKDWEKERAEDVLLARVRLMLDDSFRAYLSNFSKAGG